jgi:hypothetical protein
MTSRCIVAFSVLAIMSIGLLITAQVLTGARLLRFIGRALLLAAGIFAGYWILILLLIPGAIRVFESLKRMAAGLAYMTCAVILLFGITQLIIFTFKTHQPSRKHQEKKEL